jgi:hypothetical protein
LSDKQDEVILAQEQGVTMRAEGATKELEAEFGIGVSEGTLVLTSNRLIYVCTNEKEDDLPVVTPSTFGEARVVYSDVEDIESVPKGPPNIFIPLVSVTGATGHKEGMERPSLRIRYLDGHGEHELVFVEMLTGQKARNLNDWAGIILNIREGRQTPSRLQDLPSLDTLEGKVIHVLADMQEKGMFAIEEQVETEFKVDLDPDEVQTACEHLADQGLVVRHPDSTGTVYYQRASLLDDPDTG